MKAVIIPAYRPDRILEKIADQLWAYGYQTIVVDDGSEEEYQQVFNQIKDVCVVLVHSHNRGKGAAIKTGLRYIKEEMWDCDVIGTMDADGQYLAENLVKLAEFARMHRNTLVLGARDVEKKMPLKSMLGNRITRAVFRLISG